ncbi:hypothetical protein CAL14_08375 [Bordetella genomosp. 9]|uniref:hypothetical protein n=1 Tax=Bordetella genomosp. 9 TaxID=1416803 RepID=UPI000A2915FF|nr:hypothetical protein [Bordetella genomosp. 9]ARP90299.1 hypothetical protein CAL14_08375 [Bordetella genomosp. 9]
MSNNDEMLKTLLDTRAMLDSLRIAFVCMAKQMPTGERRHFLEIFSKGADEYADMALMTPIPESWIAAFRSHAGRLRQLIEE